MRTPWLVGVAMMLPLLADDRAKETLSARLRRSGLASPRRARSGLKTRSARWTSTVGTVLKSK